MPNERISIEKDGDPQTVYEDTRRICEPALCRSSPT